MKLYLISGRYYGTQADAKPAAVEAGIKASQIGDHEVDVPTDKSGLISYLNHLAEVREAVDALCGSPTPAIAPTPTPVPPAAFDRTQRGIDIDQEIEKADFPRAIYLSASALSRVQEHLRDMGSQKTSIADLLS
jgi:hypothetical protein